MRATSHLVAGIELDGSFDEVPDRAFRPLGGFIDGADRSRRQIAMPDPVTQQNAGPEKIVMTAPVVLRRQDHRRLKAITASPMKFRTRRRRHPERGERQPEPGVERHLELLGLRPRCLCCSSSWLRYGSQRRVEGGGVGRVQAA